jgi:WD40 repeat protein
MSGGVAPPAAASPFKGLTHFTEEDFGLFFGRERERDVIVANLKARRLTVLYGESGVGKSSLLRAGVVSTLRDEAQRDFEDDDVGRPAYVPAIVASWSGDPLQTLIDGLASAAAPFVRGPVQLPPSRRLDLTIDALAAQTDARMLVILDQLEEYFLYHGDEAGEETLASELPRALARPQLRASFLLSIREDALAKLDRFKRAVPELFDTVLAIGPLGREAGRQAIVGPLRTFEGSGPKEAEPALVEAVLDQVAAGQLVLEGAGQGRVEHDAGAPASRAIEAPYLQLVFARLWEEETDPHALRLATLERLGGAEAIVRRHLDTALGSLDEPERLVAADALRYLVTPSGTKIALGPDDLASFTGRPDVAPVLEKLTGAGARILRAVGATPGRPNGTRYEIAHDVLGAAVLDWRSRFVREQERLELERRAAAEREQLEEEKREAERRETAERRRARTFRALAGIAFLLLLAASALFAYALVQKGHAERERHVSEAQALAAEARNALHAGGLNAGIPLALAAYHRSLDSVTAQDAVLDAVHASAGLRRLLRFREPVQGVAADPLGPTLAAAVGRAVVLRTIDGAVIARTREAAEVRDVAFSADGKRLAAARYDGVIALFRVRRDRLGNAETLQRLDSLSPGKGAARSVAFGPGDQWIAAAMSDGVIVWRLHGAAVGAPRPLRSAGDASPGAVAFCTGSRGQADAVAAAFSDGRVVLWPSTARGVPARTLGTTGRFAGAVACSPDGKLLAAGGEDKLVTLFRVDGGRGVKHLAGHTEGIRALAFSRDGRVLASGADDHSVILWDVRRGWELEPPLRAHTEPVVALDFGPGGELAAASTDGRASVWSADELVRAGGGIEVAQNHLNDATLGKDVFAAVTSGRMLVLHRRGRVPDVHDSNAKRIAVDAGGRWLALGFQNKEWLFRLGRGDPKQQELGGQTAVDPIALARDGTLAGARPDGAIRVWDAPGRGKAFHDLHQRGDRSRATASALAIAPDAGEVSASYDDRVVLWRSRRPTLLLRGADGPVTDLDFSAGGSMLAAGAGHAVVLWDTQKARPLASLSTGANVLSVAFSPDGGWLASSGEDGTVRLWDVVSRRELGEPLPARTDVKALGFTGSSTLGAAFSDGTLAEWDLKRWRIATNFERVENGLRRVIGAQ